jgi:diaminopimelate epimerase
MHVCGNDFIIIDWNKPVIENIQLSKLAVRLCNRHTGIGADELILLSVSTSADIRVNIFNPNGTEAPICGNALLSIGHYISRKTSGKQINVSLETRSGIRNVHLDEEYFLIVSMGKPFFSHPKYLRTLPLLGLTDVHLVYSGTQHAIIFVDELSFLQVDVIGAYVEHNIIENTTTNVMFVQQETSTRLKLRSWERGGNGETMACGSGACAAAYVTMSSSINISGKFEIVCAGGIIEVIIDSDRNTFLKARSNHVFDGSLEVESFLLEFKPLLQLDYPKSERLFK